MTETQLTLDKLLAATPDMFKPLVLQYGPALVAMTAQEFCDWLTMLIKGDDGAAWRALLAKLPDADLIAEWDKLNVKWDEANAKNADRVALQKSAVLAVLKVLLAAALSMVVL
jgi:hypothetical protein